MCGICGAVALERGRPVDATALERMSATMVHRGPDAFGERTWESAGLAIRRLAIIDLVGAQQPLANEDGQVQLVCNGEIYNFRELRSELLALGHRFRTNGDCEVIVHAYEQYGDDFLARLNGIFALALWDDRQQRLVLARDRVGVKPLHYARHNGYLLFASEPKALLAYPGFPRRLDLAALDQYLTYEYVPTPDCIFAGVAKLRPGHVLVVEHGQVRESPYWQPVLTPDPLARTAAIPDLARQLWETIRDSVRMELLSDVPLGVFLSGGIDSSAVAAAAADLNQGEVRTFSIGFQDSSFDESRYARQVAAYLGTTHFEQFLRPEMVWQLVPALTDFLDEPLADASILPTHLLSRFAREQVTVALGGDGGDELFAGYSTLQAHKLMNYYRRLPSVVRESVIAPLVRRLPVSYANMSLDFRAKRFVAGANAAVPDRHQLWLGAYTRIEKQMLLRDEVMAHLRESHTLDVLGEHLASAQTYDELSQVLYLDMKMYLESDILLKVDRASMACSLEVRVPLLNPLLLQFALRLPVDLKLRGFTRKYLLRKALDGRLPPEIINRPKKGFGVPIASWLRSELRPLLLDLLSEGRLKKQGIFNSAYVQSLVSAHLVGKSDNRKLLWPLVVFQLWYDRYGV